MSSKSPSDAPELSDKAFVNRDCFDVFNCEITLCNLLGADKVSIGSVCEVVLSSRAAHNLVIIVMEERGNIHDHPFIREAGVIFHDLDDAIDYILTCAGEEPDEEEK